VANTKFFPILLLSGGVVWTVVGFAFGKIKTVGLILFKCRRVTKAFF